MISSTAWREEYEFACRRELSAPARRLTNCGAIPTYLFIPCVTGTGRLFG